MATNDAGSTLPDLPEVEYTLDYVSEMAERAQSIVNQVRASVFKPNSQKVPPKFGLVQLANLCGVDKNTINRRLSKAEDPLPKGVAINAARREFTLPETQQWIRAFRPPFLRPPGVPATVIASGNFKGGVAKTTTTACVAQGLSLKGYKVLVIDFDPQGSLTNLFGFAPETDVQAEDTFYPLAAGTRESLRPSIRKTYWSNVDLVPSAPVLFNADFYLPLRQTREPNFQFWDVLNKALDFDGLRQEYDYIIIDTPPSLSYMTLNAFFAADGLLVPLPPEGPDFASSAQFWGLFSELGRIADGARQEIPKKRYSWIRIVPSKVDRQKPQTAALLEWMNAAYGSEMMPVEIPSTAAVSYAGTTFGTVYDISKYVGAAKTYTRARDAYDSLVDRIDGLSRVYKWHSAS